MAEDKKNIKTETLNNYIGLPLSCGNCNTPSTVSMTYEHAAILFQGKDLTYTCNNCGQINSFKLSHIKEIIDDLPKDKKNHFYDFLSSYTTQKETQTIQYVSNDDSGASAGLIMVGIIIFLIGLYLAFINPFFMLGMFYYYGFIAMFIGFILFIVGLTS